MSNLLWLVLKKWPFSIILAASAEVQALVKTKFTANDKNNNLHSCYTLPILKNNPFFEGYAHRMLQ